MFSVEREFVEEYYIQPEKMTVSSAQFEAEEGMANDDLDEGGPTQKNMVEPEQQNHSSDSREGNVIAIKE